MEVYYNVTRMRRFFVVKRPIIYASGNYIWEVSTKTKLKALTSTAYPGELGCLLSKQACLAGTKLYRLEQEDYIKYDIKYIEVLYKDNTFDYYACGNTITIYQALFLEKKVLAVLLDGDITSKMMYLL